MKQDGMSDSDFLRSLAYNDYNIDGHLLSDGDRLCVISDRLELFEKTIECLRSERDEARRSLCECRANGACDSRDGDWFADDGRHILAREYAAERGWDCFKEEQ
jgi:hypothetical protein